MKKRKRMQGLMLLGVCLLFSILSNRSVSALPTFAPRPAEYDAERFISRREVEAILERQRELSELASEQIAPDAVLNKQSFVSSELDDLPTKVTMNYLSSGKLEYTIYKASAGANEEFFCSVYEKETGEEIQELAVRVGFKGQKEASCTIDVSSLPDGNYNLYHLRVVSWVSGGANVVAENIYPFAVKKGELSFESAKGEHEFTFYKNLVSKLDPEQYAEVPERYYTALEISPYYTGDQMEPIIQKAKELTTGCTTTQEKVRKVHDWICENIAYDHYYVNNEANPPYPYRQVAAPYYVFQNGIGVCAAYARIAQIMLTSQGIPCVTVVGKGNDISASAEYTSENANHEWNLVYIDNEWYVFDFTWDSTNKYNAPGNVVTGKPIYSFYGITPYMFGNNHYSTQMESFRHVDAIEIEGVPTVVHASDTDARTVVFSLRVTMSDGTTKTVTSADPAVKCEGDSLTTAGVKNLQVSYGGKSKAFQVTVADECTRHSSVVEYVLKEATCTEKGIKVNACRKCGLIIESLAINAVSHKASENCDEIVKEPTCNKTGLGRYFCVFCHSAYIEKEIPATGKHDFGDWTVTKEANCQETGKEERSCQNEGCEESEERDIAPNGKHVYGAWTVTVAASCWKAGERKQVCTVDGCGHTETEPIAATGQHSYGAFTVYKAADCIHEGEERKYCQTNGCTDYVSRVINATGVHDYGDYETTTAPDCIHAGEETCYCRTAGCDSSLSRPIAATGKHVYGDWVITDEPSCYQAGERKHSCKTAGCTAYETEEIEATGEHIYGDWTVTKEPSCYQAGERKHVCTTLGCGREETEEIEATGEHVYGEWLTTKEPSCYQKGLKKHTCKTAGCGHEETADVDATGQHSYGEFTVYKAADCIHTGEDRAYCRTEGCDAYDSRVTDATGEHVYGDYEITTAPDCIHEGEERKYCQTAGCTDYVSHVIAATGVHDYGAYETTTAPDCIHAGEETCYCRTAGCGSSLSRPIAATGKHVYGDWVITDEPSCYQAGERKHSCKTAGCTAFETEEIAATGEHVYGEWTVTKEPSCYQAGERKHVCTTLGCGREETEVLEATGEHVYGEWLTTKEPSCYQAGERKHVCTTEGCGHEETEEIKATGKHVYGDWTVIKEPSCWQKGEQKHVCQTEGCGHEETEAIEATGQHSYKGAYQLYRAADCIHAGEERDYCTTAGCESYLSREIKPTGSHTMGPWKVVTKASCCAPGLKKRVCVSGCGEEETQVIPATGKHEYGEWVITAAPSCCEPGEKKRSCRTPGCTAQETDIAEATGVHEYGEWIITAAPSCCQAGEKKHICQTAGCGHEETEVIEASGEHKFGEWIVEKEATESAEGSKKRSCQTPGCVAFEKANIPKLQKQEAPQDTPGTGGGTDTQKPGEGTPADSENKPRAIKLGNINCDVICDKKAKTVTITKVKGSGATVTIPDTVKVDGVTCRVESIEKNAFAGNKKLKSIAIGKNVKRIGAKAFYNCKNLKKITIKSKKLTDKTVGKNAFKGVPKSAKVKVPAAKKKAYQKLLIKKGLNKKTKIG